MSDLFPDALPDLDAQIKEVRREIAQRERVYPRWVADGRMTQAAADRQIGVMRAALNTLITLRKEPGACRDIAAAIRAREEASDAG